MNRLHSLARTAWRPIGAAGCLLLLALPADAARYRVCMFSFHNPDETAVFQTMLPASDFEIVDLSPAQFGVDPPAEPSSGVQSIATHTPTDPWPLNLCQAEQRCDVLVIAGEFAGRFFGKNGHTLTLQEMDEAACQARCSGLFHNPLEVFLLACNTLATKDEDRRTPDEYRRVLLEHGFDGPSAEQVVELRYGPMGQSFRESLRRIFTGVPRVYGFSSVAPVGQVTAPMLTRYFQARPDYAAFLDASGRQSTINQPLLAAMSGTGMVQTHGLAADEPGFADRREICTLYDSSQNLTDRLAVVQRLFDRPDRLSFLPTIDTFFTRHPPGTIGGAAAPMLDGIRQHGLARTQVLDMIAHLNVSALKLEIAHLARQLDWMTRDQFRALAIESARELLRRGLTSEVVDVTCEATKHEFIGDAFRSADVPGLLFTHAEGLRMVDCLGPTDPEISRRLATALDHPDPSARAWAVYALSRRLPLEESVLRTAAAHLNDPSNDVREPLRSLFRLQARLPSPNLRAILTPHDPQLADQITPRRRRFLIF